jgi:hypothetical protein
VVNQVQNKVKLFSNYEYLCECGDPKCQYTVILSLEKRIRATTKGYIRHPKCKTLQDSHRNVTIIESTANYVVVKETYKETE